MLRSRAGVVAVGCVAAVMAVVVGCVPPPAPQVPDPGPVIIDPVPDEAEEVTGYVDLHNHLFSNVGFGGRLLCGEVFNPAGIAAALKDCPDHLPNGQLALFENVTNPEGGGTHDPTGWPTFADWPTYSSLTHQQNYYEWVQRAWEGGLRVMVNQLVTNRQLCEFWFFKDRPCDEMTSIRLQAQLTHDLEAFIDAQYGGAGKGWFRVAESAQEARQVIAEGKLAVIIGVETSEPFGCRLWNGHPTCTADDIDRGLDEMASLGVSSMFVCHKFDNALCGVRFDGGAQGLIINIGNKLSTNRFWRTEPCPTDAVDNTILGDGTLPQGLPFELMPGDPLPLYGPAPHCNPLGLTALGEHMVKGMMERGMLVEVDHMSVKAAGQSLDLLEEADYPGVVSSHSWVDSGYEERIYALGGMIGQYGSRADSFAKEWNETEDLRDTYGIEGYGIGTDANGFGGLAPPYEDGTTSLAYPFAALDGHPMDRATTGLKTWDLNTDGMAHYGLLADLFADISDQGEGIAHDMAAGAEQYLSTLEAAETHPAN